MSIPKQYYYWPSYTAKLSTNYYRGSVVVKVSSITKVVEVLPLTEERKWVYLTL